MVNNTTSNNSDLILAKLAEGLDSTAKMTQALLSDLRDSEADFAAVKTELNILKENVRSLSQVIRDGDGATSILTRVALIEQNIDNIKQWMDKHVDVHQTLRKEFTDIRRQISDIERRLHGIEKFIDEIEEKERESERSKRASIDREIDLEYEIKKNKEKVKAERIKIIAAIVIGLVGIAGGYLAKKLIEEPSSKPTINNLSK